MADMAGLTIAPEPIAIPDGATRDQLIRFAVFCAERAVVYSDDIHGIAAMGGNVDLGLTYAHDYAALARYDVERCGYVGTDDDEVWGYAVRAARCMLGAAAHSGKVEEARDAQMRWWTENVENGRSCDNCGAYCKFGAGKGSLCDNWTAAPTVACAGEKETDPATDGG